MIEATKGWPWWECYGTYSNDALSLPSLADATEEVAYPAEHHN